MKLPGFAEIKEVGPRDGLQNRARENKHGGQN